MKRSFASALVAVLLSSQRDLSVRALPSYALGIRGGSDVDPTDQVREVAPALGEDNEFNYPFLPKYSRLNCWMMGWVKQAQLKRIACPAMRFLVREGIFKNLFNKCGYESGSGLSVDVYSMKALIADGKHSYGKPFYQGLKFNLIMTKKVDGVLSLPVSERAFKGAIDDQARAFYDTTYLNMAGLQEHFDHSASSGIIGSATNEVHGQDLSDHNEDKFQEFVLEMNNNQPVTRYNHGPYDAEDVGRAVNHFGKKIEDETIRDSTDVGAFSWGILAFEWANTFVAFRKNGQFSYSTYRSLFAPRPYHFYLTGINIQRDVLQEQIWLGDIICDMNIQISDVVKEAMDASLVGVDCAHYTQTEGHGNAEKETQCKIHGLLTDICGDGYANCLAGDHPCDSELKIPEGGDKIESYAANEASYDSISTTTEAPGAAPIDGTVHACWEGDDDDKNTAIMGCIECLYPLGDASCDVDATCKSTAGLCSANCTDFTADVIDIVACYKENLDPDLCPICAEGSSATAPAENHALEEKKERFAFNKYDPCMTQKNAIMMKAPDGDECVNCVEVAAMDGSGCIPSGDIIGSLCFDISVCPTCSGLMTELVDLAVCTELEAPPSASEEKLCPWMCSVSEDVAIE